MAALIRGAIRHFVCRFRLGVPAIIVRVHTPVEPHFVYLFLRRSACFGLCKLTDGLLQRCQPLSHSHRILSLGVEFEVEFILRFRFLIFFAALPGHSNPLLSCL